MYEAQDTCIDPAEDTNIDPEHGSSQVQDVGQLTQLIQELRNENNTPTGKYIEHSMYQTRSRVGEC